MLDDILAANAVLFVVLLVVVKLRSRPSASRLIAACRRGDYDGVAKELKKARGKAAVRRLLTAQDHEAFVQACDVGAASIAQLLLGAAYWCGGKRAFEQMFEAQGLAGYHRAIEKGHFEVFTMLLDLARGQDPPVNRARADSL